MHTTINKVVFNQWYKISYEWFSGDYCFLDSQWYNFEAIDTWYHQSTHHNHLGCG